MVLRDSLAMHIALIRKLAMPANMTNNLSSLLVKFCVFVLLSTIFITNPCEAFPWFWNSDEDLVSDEPSAVSNSWKVGEWSACSRSCGAAGTQARSVICQQTGADGSISSKDDSDCLQSPKPALERPCNTDQPCPEWQPTPWSDCSEQCDEGVQTREVACIVQLGNKRKHLLPESQCDADTKPATSQTCNSGPCATYEWISSDWSGCHHHSCEFGATETRVVMCVNVNGQVSPPEQCASFDKPSTSRSCVVQATCKAKPQWHASQWGPCSAKCGSGMQHRKVFCAVTEGTDHLRRRPSEECDPATKMEEIRDCQGHNCSAVWFTGLYGKCSKECDGGERKRVVMCVSMATSQQVADGLCDAASRPADADHCNQQPCNAALPGRPSSASVKESSSTTVLLHIEPPSDNGGARLLGYGVFHDDQHHEFTLDGPFFIENLRPGYSYEFTIRARSEVGLGEPVTLAYTMPDVTSDSALDCQQSKFGCCPDGTTPADGPHQHGCLHQDRVPEGIECAESHYGCCPDGTTAARGPNGKGCDDDNDGSGEDADAAVSCNGLDCRTSDDCSDAKYGCCPDGISTASGPDFEGCTGSQTIPCDELIFGCCHDGTTPAVDRDGSNCPSEDESQGCSQSTYGCCPDGVTYAHGPDLQGCAAPKTIPCEDLVYGCCPDGTTPAVDDEGTNCPQEVVEEPAHFIIVPTVAAAAVIQDCYSSEFGCCPDGQTTAQGPDGLGCGSDCASSMYGCCLDGVSAAAGMNFEGCGEQLTLSSEQETCATSTYGCCSDGVTSAFGPQESGCPSKLRQGAYCKMPSETNVCGEYEVKWFFDSAVGICTRDWYSGCEIDAHHFDSEDDCQASCVTPSGLDKCYLPPSVGRCRASVNRYFFNATSRQCQKFVYGGCDGNANNFNDIEECQQSCEQPLSPDVCSQPSTTGPCRGNYERFYFDVNTKSCQTFIYGGCRGNGNRFATIEACENRCVRSQSTDVCNLPKVTGTCKAALGMWYYNSQSGDCEPFTYGGCDGNENRFETKLECENTCSRSIKRERQDTCMLPQDSGPCRGYFERWFFDSKEKTCKQFIYGGCHGNDNRFDTEAACRLACNALPPTDVCSLPSEPGPCYDYVLRHFYDQTSGRCEYFYYGGCEGNGNNFGSAEECEKRCTEPETERSISRDTCRLSMDVGPCSRSLQRWYFSATERRCIEFTYGGCQGNGNRFTTEDECQRHCGLDSDESSRPEDLRELPPAASSAAEQRNCVDFRGHVVAHGERYNPHEDPCLVCICHNGRDQHCMISHCQPPNCDWVPIEGQCCKFHCRNSTNSDTDDEPGNIIDEPCSDEVCQHQCPYGFVQSSDGCKSCRCHQPCKKLLCSYSLECQLQDVYCDTALCSDGTSSCHQTGAAKADIKSGLCPRPDILHQPSSQCNNDCYSDEDCAGLYRCCETSCGGHTCMPTQGTSSSSSSADDAVEVQDHIQASVPAVVGETVSMPCRNGKTSDAIIKWFHDRMLLPEDPGEEDGRLTVQPDGTLVMSGVSEDDNLATFTCLLVVNNDFSSTVAQTYAIDIQEPPRFTDNRETHRSLEPAIGSTIQLECPVGGNPHPVITWHKDGHVIYEGKNQMFQKGETIMVIGRVQQSDGGNYECEVYNGIGSSVIRAFTVEPLSDGSIYRPLEQHSSDSSLHFTDDQSVYRTLSPALGSTVRLDCPIGGSVTPLVTWLKNSYPVEEDNNVAISRDGLVLVIHKLQFSDGGEYECKAENGLGDSLGRIFVVEPLIEESVFDPLGHDSSSARMIFLDDQSKHRSLGPALGSTVQLQCPVAETPPPRITWLKDGVVIGSDSSHVIENGGTVFVIHNLQDSDGGNYECEVTNGVTGETIHRTFTVEPLIERQVYQPLYPQPLSPSNGQGQALLEARILADISNVTVGDAVRLECRTTLGRDVKVTWTLNNQPLSHASVDSRHQIDGSNLVIEKAVKSDEGTYVCQAQLPEGPVVDSDPFQLTVNAVMAPANCVDKPWYANCDLIVEAQMCRHPYFSVFCCSSCYSAGQLP